MAYVYVWRHIDDSNIRVLNLTAIGKTGGEWVYKETEKSVGLSMNDQEPTLCLPYDLLQALMPALVKAGVRPADQGELVGKLAAQERHLVDLQTIVDRLLTKERSQREGEMKL